MIARLVIPGRFPSLNQYVRAERSSRRQGAGAGSGMKRDETERVAWLAKSMHKFDRPVHVTFVWVEQNRKRDLDNVAFAKKFILDGLVAAGVIANDTQACVTGFADVFRYDPADPRVVVLVSDEGAVAVRGEA